MSLVGAHYVTILIISTTSLLKQLGKKEKEQERIVHIQKGLALATTKIDEVISIVRGSNSKDEARRKLMEILGTDLDQTEAILNYNWDV